jgi:ribosomal protein L17
MSLEKPINNIHDLTQDLTKNYNKLVKGQLTEKRAKEISNMAGKIINSAKTQLEYNSYMKYNRPISFLDVK